MSVFVKSPKGRILKRVDEPVVTLMARGMTSIETKPTFYIDDVVCASVEEFRRQMTIDGVPKTSTKKQVKR